MSHLTADRMRDAIKQVLEDEGMTQAEFARRVGVTEKHVSRVLTGKQQAYINTLDYWAFILGREWVIELTIIEEGQ